MQREPSGSLCCYTGKMPTNMYKAYIASDKWQRKRQQVFAHYGKRCYACRTRKGPFHVHHMDYSRLGRESMSDLIPLCIPCHREVTRVYKRNRRRGLRRVTMEYVRFKRAQGGEKSGTNS